MKRKHFAILSLALSLASPALAGSTNLLISVNGGLGALGLEGVGPGIQDNQYLCSYWTSAVSFSNVSYTVAPGALYYTAGTTVNYFLTDAIGPSATVSNVLWSGSNTFSSSGWDPGTTPVFSGLNLGPGAYYLILVPSAEITWAPSFGSRGEVITTASNVVFDGTLEPAYNTADNSFPPASTWTMAGESAPPGSGPDGFDLAFSLQSTQQLVLTNIVVTPPNPFIAVSSNQQFTATAWYNDGSSQILTNGGASSTSWTALPGLPVAKNGAACAAVNGNLYAVSGTVDDNNVFNYNPAANVWAINASFPTPYTFAGAVGIGSKLYVMGGCQNSDCSSTGNELYIYDTVSNVWTSGASMPLARSLMAVGVINGKIYAAGGQAAGYASESDLQVYDPASDTWTTNSPMPEAVADAAGAVLNGKLYVLGGYSSDTGMTLDSVFVYDPTTDLWTNSASMPVPRAWFGAAAVNGLLYAIGGAETTVAPSTNLVEVYDPLTDAWSTGAPTLTAHTFCEPAVINGTIYLAGCGPNDSAVTNVESYTPQNLLWSSGNPAVASIGPSGLATGLTNGASPITASFDGFSGSTALTIVSPPTISVQPMNTSVSPNGSVTFNVGATGGDLSYQWQIYGSNIAGATGPSLTLTNVGATNIGVYDVIVSNPVGGVTSASATLASVDIRLFAGVIVNGPLGSNYLIQATSNLLGGWTTLTNVALTTQPYIFIDYSSPTNPQQFYRAVAQ